MSQDYSPSLVTKNLVFCGDAAMKSAAGPATLLYDKVNDNNGTMYNGSCLDFDGTDDYVTVGSSGMNASTTAITTSMWISFDAMSDGWILANLSIADYTKGYLVRVDHPSYQVGFYVGKGSSSNSVWSTNTLSLSTWYHIVCTYKSGEQLIYVNGVVWASGTGTGSIDYTGITTGYIGVASDLSRDFNGQIANLMIYDTVLSAANVKELYDDSKVIIPTKNDASGGFVAQTNLKCWLPMGEGAGEYVYDGSGNGSYGTIVNASTNKWLTGQTGAPQLVEGYNRPMSFDGSDDNVDTNWGTGYDPDSGLTIAGWVQSMDAAAGTMWAATTKTNGDRLYLGQYGGKWDFGYNGSGWSSGSGQVSVEANVWTHYCLAIDSTSQILYINGVATITKTETFPGTLPNDLYIGRYGAVNSYDFEGLINEFIVYDTKLAIGDVVTLAATGPNGGPLPPDPMSLSNSSNVLGYWRNDGDVTWTDRSGNGNDGVVGGSPATLLFKQGINGSKNVNTGRDNQGFPLKFKNVGAVGFNGSSDYIGINTTPFLVSTTGTLDFWVNLTDLDSNRGLYYVYDAAYSDYLILRGGGSGNLTILAESGNSSILSNNTDLSSYMGQWINLVYTQDGTTIRVYVNGVEIDSVASTVWTGHLSATPDCRIGWSAWSLNYLNGALASVRVYNRALTYAEIQQNYNSFKTRFGK